LYENCVEYGKAQRKYKTSVEILGRVKWGAKGAIVQRSLMVWKGVVGLSEGVVTEE